MKWLVFILIISFSNIIYAEAMDNDVNTFFRHPDVFEESYSNLLEFKVALFKPKSIIIENGKYKYIFNKDALETYVFEGGWDRRLFSFLGDWGLKGQGGYALIKAKLTGNNNLSYYLHIVPLGLSMTYGLKLWTKQWIIPTMEGGGNYYFYVQSGDTDGSYADGTVFHPHWALGVRLALHHIFSSLFSFESNTPYFLDAQYREIVGANQPVNFSQKIYFVGFSIGI